MENVGLLTVLVFGLILFLLATGMWIGAATGLVGLIVLFVLVGGRSPQLIPITHFNSVNSFLYTAVPMFILVGQIIFRSGINEGLYKGASAWVGFFPGGLLHTNVLSSAIFSAITGSTLATMATISTVAIPELQKRGYERKIVAGSLVCGGTLGILIPPSLNMIIYGAFVHESISQLFMGGVFPGILLSGLFMLYIGSASVRNPRLAPGRSKPSLRAMASGLLQIGPFMALIFMILGTIYLGVATPTEAGALGVVFSLVICVLYRKLSWRLLKEATIETVILTAWLMFLVLGTTLVGTAIAMLMLPREIALWVASMPVSPLVIFAMFIVMYIILGMFLDTLSMMLLTLPVTYPVMIALGFDGVWFGIVMVLMAEIAMVTPPVGVLLYAMHGMLKKEMPLMDIFKGTVPFLICMLVVVVIITAFPDIVLWLPEQIMKR